MTNHALVVTGGRDYHPSSEDLLSLGEIILADSVTHFINGDANGVDTDTAVFVRSLGFVEVITMPALYYGIWPWAGFARNKAMIDRAIEIDDSRIGPSIVVFPGGRGTADCARRAEEAGFNVLRIPLVST